MNKKYRLILLSLPISSLFIKSYLKNQSKDVVNIFIYTAPRTNFKKLNFNDNENFKLCYLPFTNNKGIFLRYDINFNVSNLRSFFLTNKNKRSKFENEERKFKNFLKKNKINISNIFEVNYGWPNLAYLTFNIFSKKVIFNKFEHGCGDIRNTININFFFKRFKYRIENFLFYNFIKFPKINNCTIFFDEIKKIINSNKEIKKISISNVKKEISLISKNILINNKIKKGRSMIIMVDYLDIKTLYNRKEILDYFKSLFKKILKHNDILINKKKIQNIYIKCKIHSSLKFFKKDIDLIFKNLFGKKLNLLFLDDYLILNYNVEYILGIFNCNLILSSFSQGQINSTKIFKLKNFMVDKWYLDYWNLRNKQELIHVDYKWLFDFFYKTYRYSFKKVLPTRL